jgi:F-type H+-transporting ATPase subunit alpha
VAIIFAATHGYLDDIAVEQVRAYEDGLYQFLDRRASGALSAIAEKKVLDDDIRTALTSALDEYRKDFAAVAAA